MRIDATGSEGTKSAALGNVGEIVGPGDVVLLHEVEDGAGNRRVSVRAGRRKYFRGGVMAEGRRRQQIGAIGERWAQHRTEITVADGEFLCQVVVERNFILVVEVHGLVFRGVLHAVVGLFADIVDANKTVAAAIMQRVVGAGEVALLVRAAPAVVKIRHNAAAGVMKGQHGGAVVSDAGGETGGADG